MSCVRRILSVRVTKFVSFVPRLSLRHGVRVTYAPTANGPAIMWTGRLIPLSTSENYPFMTLEDADKFASGLQDGLCTKCGHFTMCKDEEYTSKMNNGK